MAIYSPLALASGALPSSSSILYTPPASGVVLTQVILANKGATDGTAFVSWDNGVNEVALVGNAAIPAGNTLMVEMYVPLATAVNKLRGRAVTGTIDFTFAGLGVS